MLNMLIIILHENDQPMILFKIKLFKNVSFTIKGSGKASESGGVVCDAAEIKGNSNTKMM